MPVKKYKPTSPGTRFRVGNSFSEITTSKPEKSLTTSLKKSGGRNNQGKYDCSLIAEEVISVAIVSLISREIKMVFGLRVKTIEYDPNRSAFICTYCNYADGEKRYIIAPEMVSR